MVITTIMKNNVVRTSVLAFSGLFVVLTACSGDDGSTTTPVSQQTLDGIASALCDKVDECATIIGIGTAFGTKDTCKARQLAQVSLDSKSPGYSLTDTAAISCKSVFASESCEQLFAGGFPKECDFRGSLADGANCVADAQCVSGACFVVQNGSCGKCALPAEEGADCSTTKCTPGLSCNGVKKCVKPGAEGVACGADAPCAYPLACTKAVCTKMLDSGEACTSGPTEVACNVFKGLVCTPAAGSTKGTCAPFSVAKTGEKCGLVSANPVKIAVCENSDCVNNKCEAYVADGAACTESGIKCQAPAKCRNGKCALLDSATCK